MTRRVLVIERPCAPPRRCTTRPARAASRSRPSCRLASRAAFRSPTTMSRTSPAPPRVARGLVAGDDPIERARCSARLVAARRPRRAVRSEACEASRSPHDVAARRESSDRLLLGPGPSNPYPEATAALAARCSGTSIPSSSPCSTRRRPAAHRVPHRERADAADQRHRLRGHGGVLRQPARAGRHRDRRRQRRVRRAHVRGRAPLRRRGRARRGAVGPRDRSAAAARRARARTRRAARSRSCTRRRRPASRTTSRRSPRCRTPTRFCSSTPSRRSAASRSRSTAGASTPCYSGTQKCLGVPPGFAGHVLGTGRRAHPKPARHPPQSWYLDLGLIGDYVGAARRVPPHRTGRDDLLAARRARRACSTRASRTCGARHRAVGTQLQEALPELGFRLLAEDGHRLPQLTSRVAARRRRRRHAAQGLLDRYGIEVGGGLGRVRGHAWRIGLMGHSARPRSVVTLLGALERAARRRLPPLGGGYAIGECAVSPPSTRSVSPVTNAAVVGREVGDRGRDLLGVAEPVGEVGVERTAQP